MKRSERPFVVGRKTAKGTTLVILGRQPRARIEGPWTVRAVVTAVAAAK